MLEKGTALGARFPMKVPERAGKAFFGYADKASADAPNITTETVFNESTVAIANNGDGSGNYTNSRTGLYVGNDGRGEAQIKIDGGDLRTVKADPLPPVKPFRFVVDVAMLCTDGR